MINIIIPAYNCTETLPRTLCSLGAQTKKRQFICTIVDDCSTEDLMPIIKMFEPLFPIKYIRLEENKGPGFARQVGIDNAGLCDYVMFVDSDDMLLPNALNKLTREIRLNSPDILTSKFIHEKEDKTEDLMNENATTWVHGKVYRVEFLEKYKIRFNDLRINEDSAFNTMCLNLADKVLYLDEVTYIWTYTKTSLTRSDSDFFFKCLPYYVEAIEYAYGKVMRYKDLEVNCPRFSDVISNCYHYYEMINYYRKEDLPAFEDKVISFFRTIDYFDLVLDKTFYKTILVSIVKCIPMCHEGIYEYEHTFGQFIEIIKERLNV